MLTQDEIKYNLGTYAFKFLKDGSTIGLGTGTTIYGLIQEIGKKMKQGFNITIVPTSQSTLKIAGDLQIPSLTLDDVDRLELTIDGADEVDSSFNLIKGGGGALLQEKIVAAASGKLIILADETKMVDELGKFPLPVEVIRFGWKQVQQKILNMDCAKAELRKKNGEVLITDHGHYILDCYFNKIIDAVQLNISLHLLPGVVETGLFINMASTIVVGYRDGRIKELGK